MAFYNEMLAGITDIFRAPFVELSALWLIAPLFIMWIVLELYFDIHQDEELGWNTALGNGISMFWIAVNMMRFLFVENFRDFGWLKFIVIILLLCYSIFISYISFTHQLSPKATFYLASPTTAYYFSGIVILWAYGSLTLSLWMIIDIMLLFGIVVLFVYIVRKIVAHFKGI